MPAKKIRKLTTADQVIDALGGTSEFCRLIDRPRQLGPYYRREGRLPCPTYFRVAKELKRLGYTAPRDLWSFDDEDRRLPSSRRRK